MLNPLFCQQQDGELLPRQAAALGRERKDSLALAGKGTAPLTATCAEISHLPAKGYGEHWHQELPCPWGLSTEGDLGLAAISPHHQEGREEVGENSSY